VLLLLYGFIGGVMHSRPPPCKLISSCAWLEGLLLNQHMLAIGSATLASADGKRNRSSAGCSTVPVRRNCGQQNSAVA
jgi:hypothetical protein